MRHHQAAYPFLVITLLLLGTQAAAQEESPFQPPASPIPLERVEVQIVEFDGNTAVTDETLRQAAAISPGTVVNPTLLTEAIRRIEAAYAERGYIAEVTRVRILGEQPPRTVQFDIRETVVSAVVIEGLLRTEETALRRLMDLRAGDIFDRRVLQEDVDRLYDLMIFEEISVELESGEESGEVVVAYSLRERKTGQINIGGSYSPEGRLVGELSYTEANLFRRAQRLAATLSIGSIEGRLGGQLSYYNPFIASPRTDLFVRVFSEANFRFSRQLVEEADTGRYFERRTGFQSIASRRLDDYRRASLGLRYENVSSDGLPIEFFTNPEAGTGGWVVFPSARLVEDRRLFLLLPASGRYTNAFLEAGMAERGDSSGAVAKLWVQRNWYVPLQTITPEMLAAENPRPTRTLAIRFNAATSLGDLPFFEQFFLGGANSLRGYREQRFWGDNMLLLSTEYRHPLSRRLVGVAFVDVGDAWGSDFQFVPGTDTPFIQHRNISLRAGAGVGLLWLTGFGTLRLDVARGEDTRVHFAFGESF